MNKKTGIIIGIIIVAFIALIALSFGLSNMKKKTVDYSQYNLASIINSNDDNGNIADHVRGNKNAKVMLVEYADYQCPACAAKESILDQLLKKYGDKLGVIQRTFIIQGHKYARPAATAAEAAGLQGYWEEYSKLLFANQDVWSATSSASDRQQQFDEYFNKVSKNEGDLNKFHSDMNSSEVSAKIDFDINSNTDAIQYTPAFFIDGKFIDWANQVQNAGSNVIKNDTGNNDFTAFISSIIDKKLAEQK